MITIFTDGAARGNPGPGGWGTIVAGIDTVTELGGREDVSTNNRMELSAVIFGLESVPHEHDILVYTDSAYVVSGITRWVFGWKKNNWKTSQKEDVANRDLWERLVDVSSHKVIEWKLLKGHSGISPNERCDIIATMYADKKPVVLYSGSRDRYGVSLVTTVKEGETKKPKKSSSKTKAYSYVSKVGNVVLVHPTWDECKARVEGVSGVRFKKSVSPEDQENIIKDFNKN